MSGGHPIPPPPSFLAVPLLQVLAPPPSKSQHLLLSKSQQLFLSKFCQFLLSHVSAPPPPKSQQLLPPSVSSSSSPSFASSSSPSLSTSSPQVSAPPSSLGGAWGSGRGYNARPGSHLVSCPDPTLSRFSPGGARGRGTRLHVTGVEFTFRESLGTRLRCTRRIFCP